MIRLPKEHQASVAVECMTREVQDVQFKVKKKLVETKANYKASVDKHRRFKIFEKYDLVIVIHRRKHFSTGIYNKLKPRMYGSYKILCKINDNAHVITTY